MKRAFIRFKDESIINIPAEGMEVVKNLIMVWGSSYIVAVVKVNDIISCHVSEQAEKDNL